MKLFKKWIGLVVLARKGVNVWNHISLMGDEKKKFNFKCILPSPHAKAIREL